MKSHKLILQRFLVVVSLLFLVGCMTVGRSFPVENVHRIESGETKRSEIMSMFGTPWRTGLENGKKVWTYAHYEYGLGGQTLARDLVVRFNDDGIVASYSFSSTVAGEGE
jgi:hypothetical protein